VVSGKIEPGPVFDLVLPLEPRARGYEAINERGAITVMSLL
jgi:hypothetical protein